MRDLFSQCTCVRTYIRVCHTQECQFVLMCTQRSGTHTSRALTRENTGCLGLACDIDGGQGRMTLLDNGGQGTTRLVFCNVRILRSQVLNAADGLWH